MEYVRVLHYCSCVRPHLHGMLLFHVVHTCISSHGTSHLMPFALTAFSLARTYLAAVECGTIASVLEHRYCGSTRDNHCFCLWQYTLYQWLPLFGVTANMDGCRVLRNVGACLNLATSQLFKNCTACYWACPPIPTMLLVLLLLSWHVHHAGKLFQLQEGSHIITCENWWT